MPVLKPSRKTRNWLLITLVLSLTLAGCASTSTLSAPAECPKLPPKPALQQPAPSESYLETAKRELSDLQDAMAKWRKQLQDIKLTPK